jgi:hypothetical protein
MLGRHDDTANRLDIGRKLQRELLDLAAWQQSSMNGDLVARTPCAVASLAQAAM